MRVYTITCTTYDDGVKHLNNLTAVSTNRTSAIAQYYEWCDDVKHTAKGNEGDFVIELIEKSVSNDEKKRCEVIRRTDKDNGYQAVVELIAIDLEVDIS